MDHDTVMMGGVVVGLGSSSLAGVDVGPGPETPPKGKQRVGLGHSRESFRGGLARAI
jgi:hypothetical protein